LSVGSVQLTVAEPSPGVAVTPVGALGTLGASATVGDALDLGPTPNLLVATTVK
jgi:hypothetical protein